MVPCSVVRVTLTPPNSDAVVCPASTAPPTSRMRWTIVDVAVATWSASGTEAWVYGHPATSSSSLTPIGTPPNGSDTSATPAASMRPLAVEVAERVQRAGVDRRVHGLELLGGRALTPPEGVDERAGVPGPRCVPHTTGT